MERKQYDKFMLDDTIDIVTEFKGFAKFEVETARGNLYLFKAQLQEEDAVRLEEGKIYELVGFTIIRNMAPGKSKATLSGYLF